VRLTLLRGAEVMAQWKLKAECMRGEEREQLRELVTTRYHVAGSPEARTIARVIPPTFSAMVERAGQDNNHLQKAVNVHESAFTWVRRYKTSNTLSEKRRLKDLLLPGTAAVFQAIPSGPRMQLSHEALAFRIRQQFALKALLCGWHHAPADELVRQITEYHRIRRHDAVVDAVLLAALDADLIACREVAKHFECPYGTGASITPDGVIVMADGTVLALDVVVVGTGDKAQETARRKRFGWGSLGALERAKRARAETWETVRLAEEDGTMGRRAAEEERQKAAGLVQQAYSGGYEHPIEVGGAVFTPLVLSPYGGWHGGCGNEQWTSRTTHTGDDAPFLSYDERFEHPARTWASSSHRKFTHAAVGIAMAAATFRFMQATAKTAMRRVLGIRGGQGETLVPPTAVAGGDEGFVFEFEASDNNNSG